MSEQKPWELYQDQSASQGAGSADEQKPWESFGGTTKEEGKGVLGHARDLGLSALKSAIAVPETVVGLADIPTGGAVGKFLENEGGAIGFRPGQAKEFLSDLHTDQYKEQQREFQEADGLLDKAAVAVTNPSLIANTVTESIAPMLAGGVAARGISAATKLGSAASAAIGEGAVMAGSQAESIRQQTDDGLLTAGQSAAAVGTGILGSLFGYAGGRLAKKLGIGDVDTMIARGITPEQIAADLASAPAKSVPRQVIEGAFTEGFFEELPQSVSEQIIQNLALDKEWHEGIDDAIVMGTLAGMVMGGTASGVNGYLAPKAAPGADVPPVADQGGQTSAPPAASPTAEPPAPVDPAAVQANESSRARLTELEGQEAGEKPVKQTTLQDLVNARRAQLLSEQRRLAGDVPVDPMAEAAQDEILASTGASIAPSRQMGLDPAAGPMSAAAALAVDSGASQQVAEQAALQQAAELAQKQTKGKSESKPQQEPAQGELIDSQTGEIIQPAPDRTEELATRISYIEQQARISGWDNKLIQARDEARAELDALATPAGKAKQAAKQVLSQGGTEADASRAATDSLIADMGKSPEISISAEAPAAVEAAKQEVAQPTPLQQGIAKVRAEKTEEAAAPTDIKAITAKQIPQMTDAEIEQAIAYYGPDNKRTAKLLKEQAKRAKGTAQQPQESSNAVQTTQAQQAGAERAQAPGAPAEALPDATQAAAGVDAAARWEAMTADERQAVLTQQGGWSTEKGGLNVIGKRLAKSGWNEISEGTRATVEKLINKAQPAQQQASGKLEPTNSLQGEPASWVIRNRETGEVVMETFDKKKVEALNASKYEAVPIQQYLGETGRKAKAGDQNPIKTPSAAQEKNPADQETVSPETVTAPAAAEASNQSPIKDAETTDIAGSPASDADPIAREIEKAKQRYMRARREGDQAKTLDAETRLRKMRAAAVQADDWIEAARSGDQDAIAKLEDAGFAETADALRAEKPAEPGSQAETDARKNEAYSRRLVRTYLTKSGKVGAEVRETRKKDGTLSYSYQGEWGAGSGIDPITMANTEDGWRSSKRGHTVEEAAPADQASAAPTVPEQSAAAVSGQAVAPAETGQVFPTRAAAMQEGERIGGSYTVEPINGAGGLGPHRLVIQRDQASAAPEQAGPSSLQQGIEQAKQAKKAGIQAVTNSLSNGQYGATITLAPKGRGDGETRQLMVRPDGSHYWGDWHTKKHRDLGVIAGGKDKDGTPAYFASKVEAIAAALRLHDGESASTQEAVTDEATAKGVAPGTRINTQADRDAADRLELLLNDVQGGRSTPEGGARIAIRSVIEELRRPQTVVSVQALLETAAQRLNKNYSAQADVVYAIAEQLGQSAEQTAPQAAGEAKQNDAVEAAKYLKDFVYSLGNLEGMTDRAQVELSSDLGKSGRDTLLMQAFGISRDQAHDINNRLDARKPKKLRNEDMQEAFGMFSGLRKIVDDAVQRAAAFEAKRAAKPTVAAAPEAETKARDADRFAGNKIFTADAVAAARARMKSKLGQLNSGIDPELMMDGMTIAGAYIESGIRDFAQYAKLMSEDFGDKIKPYLLSFWEAARNYPGVDKEGMTSADESARLHADLLRPVIQAAKASTGVRQAAKEAGIAMAGTIHDWSSKASGQAKVKKAVVDSLLSENGLPENEIDGVMPLADEIYAEIRDLGDSAPAIGTVSEKPKARSKKTGAKGDMVLTQDWGVSHIDGYGDGEREVGNDTKDAFLKEARNYLNATADALRAFGYEPHLDRKGKPEKPVSVNEAGPAGSGDVTLVMRNEESGNNVYITIGDTSLVGMVPSTPSGIAIMYRVGSGTDRYATKAGNTWAPVDLSANDLAALVNSRARPAEKNEGAANAGTVHTQQLPSTNSGSTQGNAAAGNRNSEPLDDGLAKAGASADRSEGVSAGAASAGGSGAGGVQQSGQSAPGAARDSGAVRTEQQPADSVADPATAETSPKPELDQPTDFNLAGEDIGKGGLTKKYRDNIAAIRILKAMESENRVATPDERKQIARYVGWGALKGVFDPQNKQWAKEYAELKELLTEAEYKAARASTLNAHYTSATVVNGIYEALDQLGFTQGRVLEPSVGTGNFFGLMPAKMRKASQLHGVELDPLTSKIAAALYPSAKVAKATGFQDFEIPSEYFDLAIGNPPFGSEPLVDSARSPYSGASIHNYFFAKSIDKLRPGGLLTMVVSHNFLDAKNEATRRWIADRADLVSAARLPRTAFKENAGTDVVTDILVFQKRAADAQPAEGYDDWVSTTELTLTNPKTGEESSHRISRYFEQNPRNVLGEQSAGGSMYRANEYTVEPLGRSLEDSLIGWVIGLPQGIYQPIERTHEPEAADVAIPDGVKVGSYFVGDNGEVMIRGADVMGNRSASAWKAPNGKAVERMKGMIELRDLLRTQMRLERSADATEDEIEANRRLLNERYDAFKKALGFLNDPTNRRLFLDDTESALLLALEFDYDAGVSKAVAEAEEIEPREPSAIKADILQRRVMFPPADNIKVSNAKDALLASLNYKGRLDLDYMASLYDQAPEKIVAELGDVVYDDPIHGLVMADEYLSGDVKTKLAEAEAAALDSSAYKRNVDALKKVIPADKRPSEIHAALGAAFIPPEVFEQFAKEVTGANMKISYIAATGQWIVDERSEADSALNVGKWGISKMPATKILARTMAGQGVVVTETVRLPGGKTETRVLEKETEAAREKQAAMRAEWQRWLWSDPERADRISGIYNEKLNRIVPRQYDGSHMTFPGMSPAIKLLAHQKDAVWRALQSRQVLLDHVVGAGKTFEVVALVMEMRRLGIARKPLIAVPNHLTLQWRSEFSRLYPGANVLAATPADFKKGNREKFFAKMVTGDWDAVIIGHSSLKKIGLPPETEQAVLEEQIEEISAAIEDMKRARGDRNIIRDMEGIKKRLEAKMKDRLQDLGKRDKVVTFDELGVDAFAIDELHEFKNLFYNSAMDRVPGMGNPSGSGKAFDLFVKLQWMFNTFGEKAPIIGATGTPVSNSLVEMFNMQRLLQYPALKKDGLHVFDAWAMQFGSVESVYEVKPSGTGYRQSSRFAKFKNLPALMAQYQTFADTVTLDDLKAQEEAAGKRFPVPKVKSGRPINVVAKRSPQVAAFMGVPELDVQNGQVQFGFNVARGDEAIIEQNSDGTAWVVQARSTTEDGQPITFQLGTAKTEEDARLLLVQSALAPKITVDPNSIQGQFERLRELNKSTKGKVNALSLTGKANKAGLDYRLIDPSAPDFAGSKINLAIENMLSVYQKWTADKGTQLVFCDMSVPLSARAGFGSKERRLYVRDGEKLIHKRGTLHTVEGIEELPFLVVREGSKDVKSFAVYDAASGVRMMGALESKAAAITWANEVLADEGKRERWIAARDEAGEIEQYEIDDYNNENEIDTEETESITLEDIAGLSGATTFSVYDDIKAKLIAKGIPEREIAFIHDYGTPAAKDKLFKAVNNGSIRFLLGSTPKMGAGTNVQKRLVGLHHIDAPWRPSDLEQREGRIIRRNNMLYERDPDNFEVEIYRYATEQTYDTRRWQILEHKARGIEQLRKYDGTLNEIDDIEGEAANSADMKAAASGDPLILEETRLRNDVRRLESLQASHADEVQAMIRRAKDQERFAREWAPRDLEKFEDLQKIAEANPVKKDEFAGLSIDGKRYTDREQAVAGIQSAIQRVFTAEIDQEVAFTYRGVEFVLSGNARRVDLESPTGGLDNFHPDLIAAGISKPASPAGFLTRFANYINRIAAHIEELNAKIAEAEQSAAALREQAKKEFGQGDELAQAREAHKRVQRRLIAKGPDIPAAQKPMLETALEQQKEALREAGFEDALREFLGNQIQFSFAGRQAQGANLLALSNAKQRIGAGEDAETVRQETGWHRGADGKWRFEINDSQASLKVSGANAGAAIDMAHLAAITDGRRQPTTGDLLDHPRLFAAYPHLASIPISVTPEGVTAQARLRRLATGLKVEVRANMPRSRLVSALLHELQHGIQIAEGFALGGSKRTLVSNLDKDGAETYRRLAGEVEARNVQTRLRMTDRLRRDISPEETADTPSSEVIVTFNGKVVMNAATPHNAGMPSLTQDSLVRAFKLQFPSLEKALRTMLSRGKEGKRGGVVLIDSADPLRIAHVFAKKTGTKFHRAVQMFSEGGKINGFFDPVSGLTFLVGPNLDIVTGPAVLLHEMTHGQQREKLDKVAMAMVAGRNKTSNADLRAFLDRVAARMVDAGETANEKEAAAYIVEQAVMEGRSQGYAIADSRFLSWVDKAIGKPVGDFLRSFLGMIRSWMLRNGMTIGEITVDDLVGYAMAGMDRAAAGRVDGGSAAFSRDSQINSPAFKRWFGKSILTVDGKPGSKPIVLYHGTSDSFDSFDLNHPNRKDSGWLGTGVYVTDSLVMAEAYAKMKHGDAGPNVMPLYARLEKPYIATLEEKRKLMALGRQTSDSFTKALKAEGYDGVILEYQDGREIVVFDTAGVKSSIGNNGDFDPSNPDIRYSRSGVGERAKSVADAIKAVTVQDVKRGANGKFTDFLAMGLQALGRRQLVDLYDGLLPMRRYESLVERMEAEKNDIGAAADELARRWGKLKDGDKLADLMHQATLAQTDADPRVPKDKALDVEAREVLNKLFERLSPEAQAIYREARDGYKEHHRNVIEAIKERVKRSEMSESRKAKLIRQMDSEFYKAIKGVYFPLARFGKYVVAVNGPDGKIVSVHRAESMGEANALRDQLVRRFTKDAGYDVGRVTLDKEFVASRDSVSRGFMAELYGSLEEMNLPSSQLAELEDTLGQLYLASMPDLSWAKHGIHRKGTPGFSDDARRAYAQNMFHGARYLGKLRYGDLMNEELDRMQKHADARKQDDTYDQPKAQRVIDEMVKRHDAMMNPNTHPLSTALTSFGFIYYLGLSPASAVVNLSQTALVAYPIMGAKWGFDKAAAALLKASGEAVKGKNDITKSLTPEELRAFEQAVKDGTIDVTQAHDLAGIAQGEDSKVMWKIRPVMRLASFMFHQAEVFNRQVTFIASYRLAREAGASEVQAYAQAKKATYDGHFDYSSGNRPRIMQGNVAKVVLLFKQYAQNMVYTMARNAYLSVAGESPAIKKEARKVFGAIMGLHAAAAGVLGLPLVGPLLALASALGGDEDEPWDAEVALRNLMAETMGPKASEVIARGLSRLGPADISGRVALNHLILPDVQEGLEGRRLAEAWTMAALGPVAGVFTNAAVGAGQIAEGKVALGIESMLPVALRNPLKAIRYYDEGVLDRSGVVIQDEVGAAGIASQALGFSPSQVRLSFEGKSAIHDADRRLAERRTELLSTFARASLEGDQEGMTEARAKIATFNQKNPGRAIRANHMMQSVQARRRRIAQAQDGVYLPRNRADAREAGRFAVTILSR